jgi:putative transposase
MERRRFTAAAPAQEAQAALSQRQLHHQAAAHTPNHIWAIDFVHDKLSSGRSYKMFTVLDEYTREVLCVAVRSKMNAHDVLETLHPLLITHGKPEFIRSDNRSEFIATHLQDWLKKVGIKPMKIYPGSPWECGGIRKQCGTLFSRHMIQRTL